MKKLVFLGACLVALASAPARAQTGGVEVVLVRVAETGGEVSLTVERAGQAPQELHFEYDRRAGKGQRASKGYLEALSPLYQQGYSIQAVIPGLAYTAGGGVTYSTLIFTKPSAK